MSKILCFKKYRNKKLEEEKIQEIYFNSIGGTIKTKEYEICLKQINNVKNILMQTVQVEIIDLLIETVIERIELKYQGFEELNFNYDIDETKEYKLIEEQINHIRTIVIQNSQEQLVDFLIDKVTEKLELEFKNFNEQVQDFFSKLCIMK